MITEGLFHMVSSLTGQTTSYKGSDSMINFHPYE